MFRDKAAFSWYICKSPAPSPTSPKLSIFKEEESAITSDREPERDKHLQDAITPEQLVTPPDH